MSDQEWLNEAIEHMQEVMDVLPEGVADEVDYLMWGQDAVKRMVHHYICALFDFY